MAALFKKLWTTLRRLIGLLAPISSRAKGSGGGPAARWALRAVLLLIVMTALALINRAPFVLRHIDAPGVLRRFWLPALFLSLGALGWMVWQFIKLLHEPPETSPFPDIDRAWDEAAGALEENGIELSETPLFLVLGRPDSGEEALFKGADLVVDRVPGDVNSPLRVYSRADAIYVTCVGASLMGKQARILAGEEAMSSDDDDDGLPLATLGPEALTPGIQGMISDHREGEAIKSRAAREGRPLTRDERAFIRESQRRSRKLAKIKGLHSDPVEVGRLTERLRHLCRRIARDRRPLCGVNGILACFSLAATDDEADAGETGSCLRDDLITAREGLRVHCPVIALACDLDQLPGFEAFIEQFPREKLRRRIGWSFPLAPELEPPEIRGAIEEGIDWLGLKLFPSMALPAWRLETPGVVDLSEAVRSNAGLFRFLCGIRERRPRLSQIVIRGELHKMMFGGLYLVGNGDGSELERCFLDAAVARPVDWQDYVSWTAEAKAEETSYRRLTRYGYYSLAVMIVVWLVLLVAVIRDAR